LTNAEDNAAGRESSPDFAALKAKNTKRNVSIAVGALLLLGGTVSYTVVSAQHAMEEQALAAASELRGCLFGGPLEKDESAVSRFRRLQLPAQSLSEKEALAGGEKLWPASCRKATMAVKDVLKQQVSGEDMAKLDALAKFLGASDASSRDPSDVILPIVSLLDQTIPGAVPKTEAKLPARVLNVDTIADVPPLAKRGTALSKSYTEDNPGLSLPILITEESLPAPLLCSFREDSAASCETLGGLKSVKGHGLRMLGTSDASSKSLIFAGRRGSEGVFAPDDPEAVTKLYSYGGYTAMDGTVSVLGWDLDDRTIVLVQKAPGAKPEVTKLKPNFRVGNYFYSSQLLWDQVLVRGVTPKNERRLFTLPLDQKEESFELVDIGELTEPGLIRQGEEEQPHITGCRTSKATIVRVRGASNDFITFRVNGKFSMPVLGPTSGVLGCHGTTATLVTTGYAKSGTNLYHTVCTSAGCELKTFSSKSLDKNRVELRPETESDVQAVDLAGNLLVVWLAGERGGLRMRMAKPELFDKTPDEVLFDDLVDAGKLTNISTLLGFRLYSRERFAVLLLSSMAGLHAYRIAPDGTVKPFEVAGGK